MPELPEVETIRRDLAERIVGERVESVAIAPSAARTLRREGDPGLFERAITGRDVESVGRRGKYLLVGLGGGRGAGTGDEGRSVVVHLGMSGQLRYSPDGADPRERHTHVVLVFADGAELRFVDPRTFGEVFLAPPMHGGEVAPLAHLGFEPLDRRVTTARFARLLAGRRMKLKPLLMDQRFVAGIGNIYSDEILFGARLRYDRRSDSLSSEDSGRLHRAMVTTLNAAIRHRGSSLADEQYRDALGRVGSYRRYHRVYDREGLACRRCGTPIARVAFGGRSHFFCPSCQA